MGNVENKKRNLQRENGKGENFEFLFLQVIFSFYFFFNQKNTLLPMFSFSLLYFLSSHPNIVLEEDILIT